jgi:hypothetical protein
MHYEDEETHARSVLEVVLGIDLTGVELGDDFVLDVTADMLRRRQGPVASEPATSVLVALVEGLRESYHRKPVQQLLVDMTKLVAGRRRASKDDMSSLSAINRLGQAFRYGAQPADLDLVLEMCSDPVFTFAGDIEDVRNCWFDSLVKIHDDQAGKLCRDIIDGDLGSWRDLRLASAITALRRVWDESDPARISRVAEQHPDSYVQNVAKRSMAHHQLWLRRIFGRCEGVYAFGSGTASTPASLRCSGVIGAGAPVSGS